MPITAQYQTYYGIHLNHWTETWGGVNYKKLLVKDTPDIECVSTVTSPCISSTVSFIMPELVIGKYYIDGIASGHFHLYNMGTSAHTVSSVSVTLCLVNSIGSIRDIGMYETTLSYSIVSLDIIAIPFYINIAKAEVLENEKIVLFIQCDVSSSNILYYHDIEPSDGSMDVLIKIPYASGGGG